LNFTFKAFFVSGESYSCTVVLYKPEKSANEFEYSHLFYKKIT
jgi:hypothetical protein